jgi:hypothetical protein
MQPGPKRTATLLATALITAVMARAQSLSSLHIGDPGARLAALGKPTSTDTRNGNTVRKWTLPNGNDLSATTDGSGRIIFIESDWNGADDSPACDLPNLHFGKTTLAELRARFGSNGFAFKELSGQLLSSDGAVLVNSYEANGVVITFYNKVSNKAAAQLDPEGQTTIADQAKLDAISIASPGYAKAEYGDRVYDPNYKPVTWK